jgi:hypothetical protein
MFLKNGRELWREFVPMTVFVTEFIFAGKKQIIPFIVSNEILGSIREKIEGNDVEYRQTKVVGPIPYAGGDVALFVGLYRTTTKNYAVKLFNFAGNVAKAFDASGLTRYLDVADPLGAGLNDLLGMADVEFRLGSREEFVAGSTFKEGFQAYIDAPEAELRANNLQVKDAKLFAGTQGTERYDRHDYCLVEIEYLEERKDYTTLPFHRFWEQSKELVWKNEEEKARAAFLRLVQEVAVSPELTKRHRSALIKVYKANFESEAEAQREAMPIGQDKLYRSKSKRLKATDIILRQCEMLGNRPAFQNVAIGMTNLTNNWGKIFGVSARNRDFTLTNDVLAQQLKDVQQLSANGDDSKPQELADAMTLSTLNTRVTT